MIVIETCPKCGHDLMDVMLTSNPPIPKKECCNCGWSWTGQADQVVRAPFIEDVVDPITETISSRSVGFENQSCIHCPSNPANGGAGICHCVLGQQLIY